MTSHATWQIASAVLLLLAIAAGFAWFERSKPPARIVSTIAVLAAFAVIGRILFAPFPNVKPTTDIVIIAGFALGMEPGFIVGALAALVSNFYFAQGPWTPWQMFAWGLCGLLGALLAKLSKGEMGRLQLSLWCGAAGLMYGVILNFGSAINLGGSDIVTSYFVYQTGSFPFDVAHALGNFAFCMLAGPVLLKMLRRLQRRSDLSWPKSANVAEKPVHA
jgi:energy-coupling factor transport system substrate-specific component